MNSIGFANNLRIQADCCAIDAGREWPLPVPVTEVSCLVNDDCVAANAQSYWSMDAHLCDPIAEVCMVDVTTDSDGDGLDDWLESDHIFGSDVDNVWSRRPVYSPLLDFDGHERPNGAAYDIGAFEFVD